MFKEIILGLFKKLVFFIFNFNKINYKNEMFNCIDLNKLVSGFNIFLCIVRNKNVVLFYVVVLKFDFCFFDFDVKYVFVLIKYDGELCLLKIGSKRKLVNIVREEFDVCKRMKGCGVLKFSGRIYFI